MADGGECSFVKATRIRHEDSTARSRNRHQGVLSKRGGYLLIVDTRITARAKCLSRGQIGAMRSLDIDMRAVVRPHVSHIYEQFEPCRRRIEVEMEQLRGRRCRVVGVARRPPDVD